MDDISRDDDLIPPDDRRPQRLLDSLIQPDGELSDSEDEGEGGRRDHAHHKSRERDSPSAGPKFGLGVGILNSVAATHGAGPSSHGVALPRALDSMEPGMEVDMSSARASDTPRSSLPRSPMNRSVSPKSPADDGESAAPDPIAYSAGLDMPLDESATRSSIQANGNHREDGEGDMDADVGVGSPYQEQGVR